MLARSALRALPRAKTTPSILLRRNYSAHFDSPSGGPRTEATPGVAGEAIPTWLYISTGVMFTLYVTYAYVSPTDDSSLTRFLSVDSPMRQAQDEISNRHTTFVEQAAKDRHLFAGAEKTDGVMPMWFPERLNAYSPYNHSVGHTRGVLMDQLVEHYKKENPPK
ncbi:hypothetical protein TWF106_001476 [Orbilia oligospora]|uniref:Uncharacterized protein n=1 Tax=Orbilia oligospora TaxID=2813651 RepID=A0A6G1MJF7_ORBOL|nr:hypothetical protein TWF788_010726 [Orbilia oligospora]KAF3197131.1 hypothetical protein TWF679_003553 [Orbilia oligospora]KAF3204683.1 hypothetical protein TWF106_001476 [Orbilia oligospora]KAF3209073.1 hypothetical protein TWF191_000505 [Orbilia oligospora]KAF3259547.1 hypothetical protein TWF192_010409 [Orbilia oligospora]